MGVFYPLHRPDVERPGYSDKVRWTAKPKVRKVSYCTFLTATRCSGTL